MSEVIWSVHTKKSGRLVQGSHGKKYYSTESGAKKKCQQGCGLREVRKNVVISVAEYTRLYNVDRWMNCLEAAGIDNAEAYDYACELRREDPEAYADLDEDGNIEE